MLVKRDTFLPISWGSLGLSGSAHAEVEPAPRRFRYSFLLIIPFVLFLRNGKKIQKEETLLDNTKVVLRNTVTFVLQRTMSVRAIFKF